MRLRRWAGSPEALLFAYVIRPIFSRRGSFSLGQLFSLDWSLVLFRTGEEDQTRYDLSRLRKPDDGERPGGWSDAPDIPHKPVIPLGSSDRPDIGDFISGRLNDADDDPGSPPFETPINFNYEGGGSDAGSLSSLNTSSSGDQDYDYLNEWGPKFAKLADMYNNYDSD